jgi:O-antigen/teichoic acid export membrane protein
LTETLKQQAIKGVFWSFLERFGTQFILLISQIVLARLLKPSDFGIIGILIVFVTISQVFVDSGFGNALIQKKGVNSIDYSTVFYCNIGISILLYVLLFVSSPIIADFYSQPELKWLLRLVSLVLVSNSLGLVQFTKFKKELKFKIIAKTTFWANVLSAIVGILLAYLDFGVWALAIQMVLIYFFRTVFFWILSDWRPLFVFSRSSFKGLFNFGYKLLLSSLLDQVFRNIYILIIGKFYTPKDLGFYTQAKNFQEVPVITLSAVVGSVTFPAFSRIQDDNERLFIGYRKVLKLLVFINFPLMLGLAIIAHPLFLYLLGEQWLPAVPYFQLLCVSGMLYTLQTTNLSILQVKGRTDLFLKLEIIKKFVIVLAIIIGSNWGVMGLVCGRVASSFIAYFINSYYSGSLLNYSIRMQLRDLFPAMIITLLMAAIMLLMSVVFVDSFGLFVAQMIVGVLSYFTISYLSKQEACIDGIKIIKEFIPIERWKIRRY